MPIQRVEFGYTKNHRKQDGGIPAEFQKLPPLAHKREVNHQTRPDGYQHKRPFGHQGQARPEGAKDKVLPAVSLIQSEKVKCGSNDLSGQVGFGPDIVVGDYQMQRRQHNQRGDLGH